VLALAIGLLLNAPGIHKSAYNKPDGWQRDVTVAVTGPLADVSHALLLDRPRKAVQAAVGRSDADEIDTEIALPDQTPTPTEPTTPTPSKPTPTPTAPKPAKPKKLAFSPSKKLRLWVAGDSLVITPGYAVVRAAGASPAIESVGGVDGRVATGLTRPDVFNWFKEVAEQVERRRIDVAVFCFGGNDDHDLMTGVPNGVSLDGFGGPKWIKEYRRRVGGIMDTVNQAGGFVVWLGLPITDDAARSRHWRTLNEAAQAEAQRREGSVAFVDMWSLLSDDGEFATYLESEDGELEKVRAPDGVHLERAGGDIVAGQVERELRQVYDVWSWKDEE
jgi:uncharacterized protein